jgi:Tol biopolymer transport system component
MDRHSSGVLEQLKERHIVRWGIAYIAGAWVALQAAELLAGIFDWSTAWLRVLTILLVFGFFAAVTLAWFHGEKGQQRFNRVEVAILVLIAIVAGITTYSMDLAGDEAPPANLFAGKASKRATANTYFEGDPSWSPGSDSLVFVSARSGNNDLWLLQRGGGETQLTDHPAEDTQAAWSPDGHTILFVSSRGHGEKLDRSVFFGYAFGGDIWSVPAFGGEPRKLLDDGYNPSWSPDGKRFAFDSSRDGSRRIWTASLNGEIGTRLSSDDSDLAVHIRPAWSPDGNWIVYERQPGTQASAAALVLVSADGKRTFELTDGSHRDMSPAWANNSSIVFASDRGGAINLWQVNVDFDEQRARSEAAQITLGAGEDIDPAIAADGTLAYATLRHLQNLWSVGVDPVTLEFADNPERIMSASWNDLAPATAPDKSALVFSSDRDGKFDIWLLPQSSDLPVQLTDLAGQDLQAVWSPDSSKLAFFSDERGNNDIWVMNLAGGPPVVITPPESNDVNPYWSPDGSQFGFTSDRSGQSEVWKMNVDGSEAQQLTDIGMLGHTARWSPDANWLLFTSIAEGDRDIWAINSDGSELLRLTTAPTQDAHGLWSADGKSVLYLSDHQKVFARPFDADEHRLLFDLGERIDFVHLSDDGETFVFTRQKVEGDVWLIE